MLSILFGIVSKTVAILGQPHFQLLSVFIQPTLFVLSLTEARTAHMLSCKRCQGPCLSCLQFIIKQIWNFSGQTLTLLSDFKSFSEFPCLHEAQTNGDTVT